MTGPRQPPDTELNAADVAVLDALLAQTRATIRSTAARTGMSAWATMQSLGALRTAGLVAWETGCRGTLRPTCRVVQTTRSGKLVALEDEEIFTHPLDKR